MDDEPPLALAPPSTPAPAPAPTPAPGPGPGTAGAAALASASPAPSPATTQHGERNRRAVSILFLLFKLRHQRLIEDFSCAVSEQILLHGRMYVTEDAVCFYSNIFGHETKKILPFNRMLAIRARQGLLVLPLLEFTMRPRAPGGQEKTLVFTSFFGKNRDECYELCVQLRARHRAAMAGNDEEAAATTSAAAVASAALKLAAGTASALPSPAAQASGVGAGTAAAAAAAARGSPPQPSRSRPADGEADVDEGDEFESVAGGVMYKARSESVGSPEPRVRVAGAGGAGAASASASASAPTSTPAPLQTHAQALTQEATGIAAEDCAADASSLDRTGEDATPDEVEGDDSFEAEAEAEDAAAEEAAEEDAAAEAEAEGGPERTPPRRPSRVLGAAAAAAASAASVAAAASSSSSPGGAASAAAFAAAAASRALPEAGPQLWQRLARMQVLLDVVLPLSVRDFEAAFLSNGASLPLRTFSEGYGNSGVDVTPWALASGAAAGMTAEAEPERTRRSGGHEPRRSTAESSLDGDNLGSQLSPGGFGGSQPQQVQRQLQSLPLTRSVRMIMPVDGGPFVTKQTAVEEVQRLLTYAAPREAVEGEGNAVDAAAAAAAAAAAGQDALLVVDSSARSFDVPFGDCFMTEETWLVLPAFLTAPALPLRGSEAPPPAELAAALSAAASDAAALAAVGGGTAPAPESGCCRFISLVYLNFSKSVWLRDVIVAKTTEATRAFLVAYAAAMRSHIVERRAAQLQDRRLRMQRAQEAAQQAALPAAPKHQPARPLSLQGRQQQASLTGGRGPVSAQHAARHRPPAHTADTEQAASGSSDALSPEDGLAHAPPPASAVRHQLARLGSLSAASGTGGSSGGSEAASVLSPSLAAALRQPSLPRDELMETFSSPRALAEAEASDVLRHYTQLYSAHSAAVAQTRALQAELAGLRASAASATAATSAAGAPRSSATSESGSRSGSGATSSFPLHVPATAPGAAGPHVVAVAMPSLATAVALAAAALLLFAALSQPAREHSFMLPHESPLQWALRLRLGSLLPSQPLLPHSTAPAPAVVDEEALLERLLQRVLAALAAKVHEGAGDAGDAGTSRG